MTSRGRAASEVATSQICRSSPPGGTALGPRSLHSRLPGRPSIQTALAQRTVPSPNEGGTAATPRESALATFSRSRGATRGHRCRRRVPAADRCRQSVKPVAAIRRCSPVARGRPVRSFSNVPACGGPASTDVLAAPTRLRHDGRPSRCRTNRPRPCQSVEASASGTKRRVSRCRPVGPERHQPRRMAA